MKPSYSLKLHTLWDNDEDFEKFAPILDEAECHDEEDAKAKQMENQAYKVSETLAKRLTRAWKK